MRCWRRIGAKARCAAGECGVRLHIAIAAGAVALLAAGCTASVTRPAPSPTPAPPDPHTAAALLKIATAFNQDYDSGKYAPVYARWDARSQAIISEADYIQRHEECPGARNAPSRTENASPGPHGAWL